jgi:hypothetical protein
MTKRRNLSQRQLTVLDDLFNSDLDEEGVLDKHKVRRGTYERWLADELFLERFNRHINSIRRRSELLMAKYSCLAAAKLVELTASDRAETARRACLDIIGQPKITNEAEKDSNRQADRPQAAQLPNETASRLLAVLADEKTAKDG